MLVWGYSLVYQRSVEILVWQRLSSDCKIKIIRDEDSDKLLISVSVLGTRIHVKVQLDMRTGLRTPNLGKVYETEWDTKHKLQGRGLSNVRVLTVCLSRYFYLSMDGH